MEKLLFIAILCSAVQTGSVNAQHYEWEIDKLERRAQEKRRESDSILVHLNKKWEIKLSYGRWHFANGSRLDQEESPSLSGPMNLWQLTGSWHFSERLCADIAIGIQLKTNAPDPDVISLLNGDDIELEGSGLVLLPIDLGLKYYITRGRFRPLIGIGVGTVPANYRYTLAEGNINTGITRTDYQISDRAIFGEINVGFDYRLGMQINFTLTSSYALSSEFKEAIGGYLGYNGLAVQAGLSIIL